jgi:hypothetical protein
MASDYLNSIKGNFNPTKKGEKKAKIGRGVTPTTVTRPAPTGKLSLGARR